VGSTVEGYATIPAKKMARESVSYMMMQLFLPKNNQHLGIPFPKAKSVRVECPR
jgi:hypothetical protein